MLLYPWGFSRQRILEWVAMLPSRGSSQPRDWTQDSHSAGRFFTIWATREAQHTGNFSQMRDSDWILDCSGFKQIIKVTTLKRTSCKHFWRDFGLISFACVCVYVCINSTVSEVKLPGLDQDLWAGLTLTLFKLSVFFLPWNWDGDN